MRSRLPSTRMFFLHRHEGDAGLGEGVEDGDDLAQRPTEPGEFAHDQAVASMKSSMRKSCLRAYSRMARRGLRRSCCAVETLR